MPWKPHKSFGPRGTRRVCLRCEREFVSGGLAHRLCADCRKANARNVGLADYQVAIGNGGARRVIGDE